MTDPVNDPSHYNQNGIEVIDVIETYAKSDFRLANVIKYVCRCEYKGNKLEDLKKAQWYLNRCVDEQELAADARRLNALRDKPYVLKPGDKGYTEEPPTTVDFKLDGYYGFVFGEDAAIEKKDSLYQKIQAIESWDWSEDDCDDRPFGNGQDKFEEPVGSNDYRSTPAQHHHDFMASLLDGPETGRPVYEAHLSPDRIAGDDDKAKELKDTYYDFNRFAIKGYCASCDRELLATQPHITDNVYDSDLKFCGVACVASLKEWQGR
jgi:hypothetical protein